MEMVYIPNGTKKKLEFDVSTTDSILRYCTAIIKMLSFTFRDRLPMCFKRWEFFSEGGDVGFHVYFHRYDQENEILDLVSPDRIPAHLVVEEGQIICDIPGKCKSA